MISGDENEHHDAWLALLINPCSVCDLIAIEAQIRGRANLSGCKQTGRPAMLQANGSLSGGIEVDMELGS